MKKIALISLFSALSSSSLLYAGDMGNMGSMGDSGSCCSGFFSLEGGYTTNKLSGYELIINPGGTTYTAVKNANPFAARLAAGVLNMLDDEFAVTGEVAWGYYGQPSFTPPTGLALDNVPSALTSQTTLTGFDILLGVAVIQPYFDFSFKIGTMIQSMDRKTSPYYPGSTVIVNISDKSRNTAVLPAVKLGVGYNIDSNWSLTGSYLFAYGSTSQTTITYDGSNYTLDSSNENPMINALMLGIQYTI